MFLSKDAAAVDQILRYTSPSGIEQTLQALLLLVVHNTWLCIGQASSVPAFAVSAGLLDTVNSLLGQGLG